MRQFFLFLVSGGMAAFLNWSSRFAFSKWMPFEFAVIAAFFVGLTSGFLMMRWFVFEGKAKPIIPQAGKYVFINMLALAQTLAISIIMLRWALPSAGIVRYNEALAHLTGVMVPVVTSYFGHKLLTFR